MHREKGAKLSRDAPQRKALKRGLLRSLVLNGQLETTLAKAKEARPFVERLVTISRKNDLSARRRLLRTIPQKEIVAKLLDEIGPRFKSRPGGYTRIVKLGYRPSDQAEMARLEWVDKIKNEK